MEITLEKINERSDPYSIFLDSIKNKNTARRYKNLLQSFLKLIPDQIYQDTLGNTPESRERDTLAGFFVTLARKNPEIASNIIAAGCFSRVISYILDLNPKLELDNTRNLRDLNLIRVSV